MRLEHYANFEGLGQNTCGLDGATSLLKWGLYNVATMAHETWLALFVDYLFFLNVDTVLGQVSDFFCNSYLNMIWQFQT